MSLTSNKVGCYSSSQDGAYGSEEIQLPLKSFSYDVQLAESLAYLKLEQIYLNNSKKTLDVEYIFPLNPQAAVVSFEMTFGGKTSKGIVKPKDVAERQFQDNREQNKKVGYGGYNSPSARDTMKVKIGNIQSNQVVKINISYVHSVDVLVNTFFEFRLPTAITPRYVSKMEPEKVFFEKKKGERVDGCCYWSMKLRIKSSKALKKIFSRTHQVNPNFKVISNGMWEVDIPEKQMVPNKDFSLCYTFEQFEQPTIMVGQTDTSTQAVVSFVPKFCKMSLDDAKRHAENGQEEEFSISKIKGEYIFLIDRSMSMEGSRVSKAKEALIVFLKSLPEQSYFNILSFGSYHDFLYKQSQKYDQQIINKTIEKIKEMDADYGGTQILPPVKAALTHKAVENCPRQIYLLTDGAVTNTGSVISYVAQHTQISRVHTIGIGDGCSEDLIIGCANMGKGYKTFISDEEDPSDKIIELLDRSLSPVITNIKLDYDKNLIESIVPNPQKCPYILKNEVANFYLTFIGKLKASTFLSIKYTDSLNNSYQRQVKVSPDAVECPYINKMVSLKGINGLYAAYKYEEGLEDHIYHVKQVSKEELQQRIIKESVQKQIMTQLTAFVCVDEGVADEVLKSKQKEQRINVIIKPMNPKDHVKQVIFANNQPVQSDDGSDIYEDECAFQSFHSHYSKSERSLERSQKLQQKQQQQSIELPQQMKNEKTKQLLVIDIDAENGVKRREVKNQSEGKKEIIELITSQHANGSWNDMKLLESPGLVDLLNKVMEKQAAGTSMEVRCTLAIAKYLERIAQGSKKIILIIKKAKQYINSQKSPKYDQLSKIWHSKIFVDTN